MLSKMYFEKLEASSLQTGSSSDETYAFWFSSAHARSTARGMTAEALHVSWQAWVWGSAHTSLSHPLYNDDSAKCKGHSPGPRRRSVHLCWKE